MTVILERLFVLLIFLKEKMFYSCILLSCFISCESVNNVSSVKEKYFIEEYKPLSIDLHASEGGLARINKKAIAVVYRRDNSLSHVSNNSDIVLKISNNNGKTWGNEQKIYDSPYDDRNLIVGNLANGSIIIVFRRYDVENKQTIDSGYIISSDEGKTWSDYIKIGGTENVSNQPFGSIMIDGEISSFLINYDKGVTKRYSTFDNFSGSPNETIIVNDDSKILQEPFLVNISDGKSILIFRNGNGKYGQSSYFQYNSDDGINFYFKGETNLFDDFKQPVRNPVSLRYDKKSNQLEVCAVSRVLANTEENLKNELRIYRQDADAVFDNPQKYVLKHNVLRPFPSKHWFYGYPKFLNISKNDVLYIITDSRINDLSISPLTHLNNEQANLYTFKIKNNQ
ncbi:sialidase family protein [Aquimarina sp. 2201CG5-10]|uniref:sialidase family protein n=1 Tax=Aquimarina callyspongiae TaxID=3098150 RepID=UPI002AB48419|nr:sialidase family protein [Aquimarina sp. 2201CG5-10]MDY8138684.1 sialidase family protein [Aquimarina sp. 2201CG5-10]